MWDRKDIDDIEFGKAINGVNGRRDSMARIENWSFVIREENPYLAPECKTCITGNVYEDDRFNDGDFIRTSLIENVDTVNMIVKTRNSEYKLGEISEEYKQWMEDNDWTLKDFGR